MMEHLISRVFPSYGHVSAAQQFQLARKIRANGWGNVPDLVRLVLGGSLDQEVAIHKDSDNQTLLHYFALWWGWGNVGQNFNGHRNTFDDCRDPVAWRKAYDPRNHHHPWRMLFRDAVLAGADVHAIDIYGRTPLCTLLRQGFDVIGARRLTNLVNVWLIELLVAGINLQEYGLNEELLSLQGRVNDCIGCVIFCYSAAVTCF